MLSSPFFWIVAIILLVKLKVWRYLPTNITADLGRGYLLYGSIVLLLFTLAEYRGWCRLDSDKVHNVPRGVRENPGVYRSHFSTYGRTYGGK